MHTLPLWLAAMYLPNVGPRTFFKWLTQFPNIESFFAATTEEYQTAGIPQKHWHDIKTMPTQLIEKDLQWAQTENNHLIAFDDPDYPRLLKEISDPPLVLFVQGNKSLLSFPQIAMVGARNPSPIGITNAEHFAFTLAQSGLTITSGLALGIDGVSHRGALKAKGTTIAIFGTGLNVCYPTSHSKLTQQIIEHHGALISEFPLDTLPHATNFPRRNRIIAGLSIGVLVVEAALRSGSLITARFATEQGREVFAIPGSIHQPLARGCHHLIRQGAKLVESAKDILEELNALCSLFKEPELNQTTHLIEDLTVKHRKFLQQIDYAVTPLDMIISRSGLTASEVSSMLLVLELKGSVQSVPGGYIRLTN